MRSCDVVVAGAGPAGLAAAWQLAGAGHSVELIERSQQVGGMAASFEVAGVRVDHGSHLLHRSTDPTILARLRDLLGDDLQLRPRRGRIRLRGRWIGYPLRAGELVRTLPPGLALRAGLDALWAPLRRPRADTFDQVLRAGLGPTVSSAFYEPFVTKLWGLPAGELSGELARRRVAVRSPLAALRRVRRGSSEEGRTFYYPRRGFGQLSEALAEAAVAAGATLRLGVGVAGVDLADPDEGDEAPLVVRLDDGEAMEAPRLWSTAPLPLLATMVRPAASAEVMAAAQGLQHRGLLLVYLVVDRPRYTTFMTHYFPEAGSPLSRLSEPENYRDGAGVDPTDLTVLCAEVPATVGDSLWSMGDADLGVMVQEALTREGLPDPSAVEVVVRRLPRVYPIYSTGFEAQVATVERWLREHPALLSFGRQGLFVGDNTHHALAMGFAAADALRADGTFDRLRWAAQRAHFARHVVED